MAIIAYPWIITLNINRLNVPIKKHSWVSHLHLGTRKGPHQCWLSCAHSRQIPCEPCSHWDSCDPGHCCLCTHSLPGQTCVLQGSLRSRHLWVSHTQRWGWSHSWPPGAMQPRKKSWNLSLQLCKLQVDTLMTSFVNSIATEHLNGQHVLPQWV